MSLTHRLIWLLISLLMAPAPLMAQEAPADAPQIDPSVKKKKTKTNTKKIKPKKTRRNWPVRRPAQLKGQIPELLPIPFPEGERLAFEVKMLNAVAGEVILAVGQKSTYKGKTVLPLVGFLRSSEFLNKFYTIEDKLITLVDAESFVPQKIDFFIRENGKSIDYHTLLNQPKNKISSVRKKGKTTTNRTFYSVPNVHDGLSSVYFARRLNLKAGDHFQYYLWDGRKERLVTINVVGVEDVKLPTGTVKAMRMNTTTEITGGFISKAGLDEDPKRASAWFALDEFHTPVKLTSPTKLGDAEAVLVRRWIDKAAISQAAPAAGKAPAKAPTPK
ncbi:DUF3108 domain-containing protein [Myxococcota bacterium]|nr:DUF3108 domain-containing protein [Myxococcota bacterium]MBU1429880.1 DUF3108 domain-containing protein [Myxococcota bacterium]